ncbi:eukaryotic cytochrome b561 domain-containing protein [Purpureocillium lavendulum]|uniref:Eukaryotic cytochrome b561 domain-containing protein n=1 Tax=Purpureocillium lavendulum TaxID=1247861 RepID=A0AB34FWA9_9HYPO|nr:eukaryotic cytochrome b561 domain-containing protein [Purpureocillium lavendulum]
MICIQKPIWARAITCLLGMASLAQASLQYCHQDDELPMHMCVAVDAHYNRSSQATDVLATFGYQVVHRGGWTSVGLGSSMYGALVVIGLVNAQGKPTLEIRRATGHLEPQSSSHLPPWTVPSLAVNASGWFESSFRIYGCDSWLAVQGQDKSVQPFIWATYLGEEVHAASAAAGLGMHDEKGLFSLDLGSLVAKNGPMEASQLPVIEFGKANDHAEIDGASAGYQERRSYLFHLHGLALGLDVFVLLCISYVARKRDEEEKQEAEVRLLDEAEGS